VKAIAEPARQSDDEPLISFEPILVGSVVKPLVASAILARHAGLAQMRVRYSGDTVRSVAGVPLHKGFANDANGCGADIGFTDFIRCSSNQYAAELLIQSLQEDGWTQRGKSTLVPRKALEQSAIATGMAEVFDVDAYANRTPGRLASYWEMGTIGLAGPPAPVTTDRSLIPYESRPWILFPDSAGTPADLLARYAFGGWENRWTLLGLAEAYARIATGRNVQATFLHRPGTTAAYPFPEASPAVEGAFAQVRAGLRQVPVNGTAAGLADKLRAATKDTVIVLAKTGTLNEAAAGGKLKSLAIAVGRPTGSGQSAALRCGLVAITYFEFSDDRRAKAKRTALPRIHRDFAEGALADVLGRHWGRVSGCAEPQVTTKPPLRVARR
jgi:cell division protein FtsI/penicillin-binding protein 2